MKARADYLFEVSWEVCNKVGGIYTVVKSKANQMMKHYKNYFLIGPYFKEKARMEFELKPHPAIFNDIFNKLRDLGINCHFGIWHIEGRPNTILIDFSQIINNKNQIKEELWNNYKIDSLGTGWDFEEPVLWSHAVGCLIAKFFEQNQDKKIIAHFHEWLTGAGLLYLKNQNIKIGTIFTTHATILGRTLAGNNYPLYDIIDKINPNEEAYKLNIQSKYLLEKACAEYCDVFTTVSEITGIEAEKILGRKPDILVLNGLDIRKFPNLEESSLKHITNRNKIREFITSYFFPYYTFDLNHTLLLFILGRYEFRNKGIDIFIKVLGNLNEILKKQKTSRTVISFFWIPQDNQGIKREQLENKNYYMHIKNFVDYNSEDILSKIVHELVCRQNISKEKILSGEFLNALKKDLMRFKRKGNPPLCTHYIKNELNDPIISSLLKQGLDNKEDDRVKAILYPVYLDGSDGLINLPYYDSISGCHLGIFPSYYEPWGYTPLESAALGVPAITSDLAGFGRFIQHKVKNTMNDGIFILKRYQQSEEQIINSFTDYISKFCKRDTTVRVKNKINAMELAHLANWSILVKNYIKAHNLALEKINL